MKKEKPKPPIDLTRVTFPVVLENDEPDASTEEERKALVEGNNAFALDLYRRLAEKNKTGNIFFSPYSISSALAMAYVGARGETAGQMAKTLRFTLPHEKLHATFAGLDRRLRQGGAGHKGPTLHTANALWFQKGMRVEDEFLRISRDHYRSGVGFADFAGQPEEARQAANRWIEEQTKGMIRDALTEPAVGTRTRMLLANAIYFQADWATPFPPRGTRTKPFRSTKKDRVDIPMMNDSFFVSYTEGAAYQAVCLPYQSGAVEMIFILPKSVDEMADAESLLTVPRLAEVLNRMVSGKVELGIPRFRIASDVKLGEDLRALGMGKPFSPQADFEGVSRRTDLYLREVHHSARLEVLEPGTKASAVTVLEVVEPVSQSNGVIRFYADHPFLFLIRDRKTAAILFLGRVTKPASVE